MLTPFKMSLTVPFVEFTITCPSVREPVILNVLADVIVTLLPATVALTAGLTVIEFPLKVISIIVELSHV